SVFWGIIVMVIIRLFGSLSPTPIPIVELVLSSSFAVLVFSYVEITQTKILSYYYGMVSGFLIYIIVSGFPPNILTK
ncbi:MAG: hypothetical protein ACETWG_05280, partial [Candidatus Neomarinimicrobiota bacterium]